jgi:hypothetical protein
MYQLVNILTTESEQSLCEFRRPKIHHSTSPFATMLNPASYQHAHQMAPYSHQLHDPTDYAGAQQQYLLSQFSVVRPAQDQVGAQLRSLHEQTQPPCPRMDHYAYSMSQPSYSTVDMRFFRQQFSMGYGVPSNYAALGKIKRSRMSGVLR